MTQAQPNARADKILILQLACDEVPLALPLVYDMLIHNLFGNAKGIDVADGPQ